MEYKYMLCDDCKKNEAVVHIKEIHNGQCSDVHLCAGCAAQRAMGKSFEKFDLMEIFSDMVRPHLDPRQKKAPKQSQPVSNVKCPFCHWSEEKIKKYNGKLGCPNCYRIFSKNQQQDTNTDGSIDFYSGKRPIGSKEPALDDKMTLLSKLQTELKKYIEREEYEKAAECRDLINSLLQKPSRENRNA